MHPFGWNFVHKNSGHTHTHTHRHTDTQTNCNENITPPRFRGGVKNTEIIHKKCRQRMVMLYQLRSLMVSSKILIQCYQAFVESILTFSFVCWFGSLDVSDRKIILRIAKQCGKIVGKKDIDLVNLYKKRVILKAKKILRDPSHYMYQLFETLPSNTRFRAIKCKTMRFQNSFFPTAIRYINETNGRSRRRDDNA